MSRSIIIIICVIILSYCNSFSHGFVGDDKYIVANNDFISSWNNFPGLFSKEYFADAKSIFYDLYYKKMASSGELTYRPLVTFSYMVDYSFWKLRPLGYHMTNMLLHILL